MTTRSTILVQVSILVIKYPKQNQATHLNPTQQMIQRLASRIHYTMPYCNLSIPFENSKTESTILIQLFNQVDIKPLASIQPQNLESSFDGRDAVNKQSIIMTNKVMTVTTSFEKNEKSWFVTSRIPTDLLIQVQDITFHVHKYPLASKCGYIGRQELQHPISSCGYDIKLEHFPGGSDTFETILKFCYGHAFDLNPYNTAALRCASEYLDMTEEFEDGNLISKTEAFITFVVLASWKDSITVLKACDSLSPWAENLQIVRRCCDSIAWKASRYNSSDNIENNGGLSLMFEDVATLQFNHYMRVMTTIRGKGTKPEVIGNFIIHYAHRWLPCMNEELEGLRGYGVGSNELQVRIFKGEMEDGGTGYKEQKTIIESLVSILPPQKGAVSCKFLLKMLKTAMLYSASPALIADLEKRVSMQLEDATVNDLLIPNYKNEDQGNPTNSTEQFSMHNIDAVHRILEYFLIHEQRRQQKTWSTKINKLLENYLAEIAQDPNLSVTKFQVLAEALPENGRQCNDGLYRAIDTYLKTHPFLSEQERRRLCRTMKCDRLSLDACAHAAENERLPLRTIVQVLFSEQMKLRTAVKRREPEASDDDISEQDENQYSTKLEIGTLKEELENLKKKMAELKNDYSKLQHEYAKIGPKQRSISGWSSGWRKIKKSFHTKQEGDGIEDEQHRQNPAGKQFSFRRRRSVS